MSMSRSISDFQWDSYGEGPNTTRHHHVHTHDIPPSLNLREAYAAPSVIGPNYFVSDNVPPPPPKTSPYQPPDPTPQQNIIAFSNSPLDPIQLCQHLSKYGENQCTPITTNTIQVYFLAPGSVHQALNSPNFYLKEQPVGLIRTQVNQLPPILLEKRSPEDILKPRPTSTHLPTTAAYQPTITPSHGLLFQIWDFLTGW
ncbi:hypothetical protein HMI54_014522 [Coelomomyces lativittatus]|nr:hypothetical protein HMI56_005366 [Coelomomyces lativittatus]KAJ1514077.1 hypothetical protein HMI54_014522 [Coelomomyces lativittatus]